LAGLPVIVQEEALDLLEESSIRAEMAARSAPSLGDEVLDFVAQLENKRYYVFMVIRIDHRSRLVRVASIGHVVRA
jgi:hypothetical protein